MVAACRVAVLEWCAGQNRQNHSKVGKANLTDCGVYILVQLYQAPCVPERLCKDASARTKRLFIRSYSYDKSRCHRNESLNRVRKYLDISLHKKETSPNIQSFMPRVCG